MFGICSETIVWASDNVWRIFGNLRKVLGNLRKIVKKFVISMFIYKQNNTWVHVDMEFLFLCSTWYLSSECSERLRSSWTREQKFHIYVQLCVILCLSFYLLSRLQMSCLFPMLWGFFCFFHSKNAPLVKTLTRQRVARYFQITLATFKTKTNKFI